jgi:hypothetical protein
MSHLRSSDAHRDPISVKKKSKAMREKANWASLVSIILGGALPRENVFSLERKPGTVKTQSRRNF